MKNNDRYFLSILYTDFSETFWPEPMTLDLFNEIINNLLETPNCNKIESITLVPEQKL